MNEHREKTNCYVMKVYNVSYKPSLHANIKHVRVCVCMCARVCVRAFVYCFIYMR
jgi:hypothetical protein